MSRLDELRQEIESLTSEILVLCEKRLEVSKEIAKYKQEHQLPIFQPEREQQLIEKYQQTSKYPNEVEMLLETLFTISKNIQSKVIEK